MGLFGKHSFKDMQKAAQKRDYKGLLKGLVLPEPESRIQAIKWLNIVPNSLLPEDGYIIIAEALKNTLSNDKSEEVRTKAALALGRFDSNGLAAKTLANAILNDPENVRLNAVEAYCGSASLNNTAIMPDGYNVTLNALNLAVVKDPSVEVRIKAARALF